MALRLKAQLPWLQQHGEEVLRQIGDSLPDGLLLVDREGRINFWNRAAERITGYTRTEAVGSTCAMFAGDRVNGCGCGPGPENCDLLQDGVSKNSRFCSILARDGGSRVILKNAVPLVDGDGNRVGAIETFSDVTHINELMCQQQQLETVEVGMPRDSFCGLVGEHPEMQSLYRTIELVAQADATVMILGESGTGKELVAEAIHLRSPRENGPFVQVNCSMFNENLLESELFGHVKGAFTGAVKDRIGHFEEAHGGTLLLDEIGDISPEVQLKLLRVVQQREVERVGESQPRRVDVRLLCATHRDLGQLVDQGRFRADLYFRLNVFPMHVPPLREHRSDVPLLAQHFLAHSGSAACPQGRAVTTSAMKMLQAHAWPGNVRELQNVIEFACVMAGKGPIAPGHLPPAVRRFDALENGKDREEASRLELSAALAACQGNRTRTAERLGISRVTLWKRMKRYGLQ
jgi:transcriptional regulator with PAS, ATPase and Fis domain